MTTPLPRPARPIPSGVMLGLLPAVFLLAGCNVPAMLTWSPDGSKAAYYVAGNGYVVDSGSKVLADLGPCTFAFAWSADSSTLYFPAFPTTPDLPAAADGDAGRPLPGVEWGWVDESARPAPPKPAGDKALKKGKKDKKGKQDQRDAPSEQVLSAWRDGRVTPVGRVPGAAVNLRLSPDGQWLAAAAWHPARRGDKRDQPEGSVYACAVASGRVYAVARPGGVGLAFTGPHRLAYVDAEPGPAADGRLRGRVVEAELADGPAAPRREPLAAAGTLPPTVGWIAPCDGGLLLSYDPDPPKSRYTLARFTRRDGSLKTLAEGTEGLFLPNPAGDKVLYTTVAPDGDGDDGGPYRRALAVVGADGTGRRELRDLWWPAGGERHYDDGMWPAWHGNDRVCVATPVPPEHPLSEYRSRVVFFEIGVYELAGGGGPGALRPVGSIGDDWPPVMRPAVELSGDGRLWALKRAAAAEPAAASTRPAGLDPPARPGP